MINFRDQVPIDRKFESQQGLAYHFVFYFYTGLLPMIYLDVIKEDSTSASTSALRIIFEIFPPYSVSTALKDWFESVSRRDLCLSLPSRVREVRKKFPSSK